MPEGSLSLGGVQYDILAVDRTKEGTASAQKGIDDLGVHYSDNLSNIAFNFNMITQAAQTAYSFIQTGFDATIGAAERYQDEMDNMHNMFGMSLEDAQKWRAAAIATDTDMGSLAITMRYLTQRVTDQSQAGDTLRKTLMGIGVDVKDTNGNWKDSSILMKEVLAALNKLPEGSERAGLAAEILGRNWYRMADMINNSDVAVKTFEETHAGMTEDQSEKIERFKIKWNQLADKIELAKVEAGLFFVSIDEGYQKAGPQAYLKMWFENTFNKSGDARSGAGGRKGEAPAPSKGVPGSFKDQYTGLSDLQLQLKETTAEYEKYIAAMKTDTTQEQFDLDAAAAQKAKNQIDALNQSLIDEKMSVATLTDAYSQYTSAMEKMSDLKKKDRQDQEDYLRGVQFAGDDISQIRRLTMARNSQIRRGEDDMSTAMQKVSETGAGVAQAAAGNLIINIDGKALARIPGVIAGGISKDAVKQRGYGTSTS